MWRPAHGATSRPGPSRPASGYGRALGRPGPEAVLPVDDDPRVELVALVWAVEVGESEADVAAPVTP